MASWTTGDLIALKDLLEEVAILEESNLYPDYSLIAEVSKRTSYKMRWRGALESGGWHFLTTDLALFQFRVGTNDGWSLGYLPSPLDALSYSHFLQEIHDTKYSHVGESLRDEYEQYLAEANDRDHCTPVRYDFDPQAYRPGVHPRAHVHIGEENEIRLACDFLLNPRDFVWLALRLLYPRCWEVAVSDRLERYGALGMWERLHPCERDDEASLAPLDELQFWLTRRQG